MSGAASGRRIERRIFVVGVPRSGTTLVQSLLAAHAAATSFSESHFFDRHFTLLPRTSWPLLTRDPAPRLREFLAENGERPPAAAGWFDSPGYRLLRTRPLLPLQTRRVARRLLRVVDELALGRGKRCWVEKTPRHLRYVPFLARLSGGGPRTVFVHVIRDGLEVVASLRAASRRWQRAYDLDECVARWNADVGLSLARAGAPDDRFVFYEELTSRPEATLGWLLAGLGLDWQPEILERYAAAAERLVTEEERPWKADVGRDIRPAATARQALTEEERRRAGRALRRELYDRLRERAGPPAGGAGGQPTGAATR